MTLVTTENHTISAYQCNQFEFFRQNKAKILIQLAKTLASAGAATFCNENSGGGLNEVNVMRTPPR
jgi:hypothetical protein